MKINLRKQPLTKGIRRFFNMAVTLNVFSRHFSKSNGTSIVAIYISQFAYFSTKRRCKCLYLACFRMIYDKQLPIKYVMNKQNRK